MVARLFVRPDLITTVPRAARALAVGAVVGTAITALGVAVPALIAPVTDPSSFRASDLGLGLIAMMFVVVVAFIIWAAGLAIVGGPVWAIAHRFNIRGIGAAFLAGGLAPSATYLAWTMIGDLRFRPLRTSYQYNGVQMMIDGQRTWASWKETLSATGMLGVAGCVVALVVWFVAYRRTGR